MHWRFGLSSDCRSKKFGLQMLEGKVCLVWSIRLSNRFRLLYFRPWKTAKVRHIVRISWKAMLGCLQFQERLSQRNGPGQYENCLSGGCLSEAQSRTQRKGVPLALLVVYIIMHHMLVIKLYLPFLSLWQRWRTCHSCFELYGLESLVLISRLTSLITQCFTDCNKYSTSVLRTSFV